MFAIIDYGVGNLFSLQSSLQALQIEAEVTRDVAKLEKAEHIILPGVGAFGDAMQKLQDLNLVNLLRSLAGKGVPLLGICLGMQLLFEQSEEFGKHCGLGLVQGQVVSLEEALKHGNNSLKIPHMGWNRLKILKNGCPIMKYSQDGDWMYYVHGYYANDCEKSLISVSEYGVDVPGVVQNGKVFGTQFHPEKSGEVGLQILRAFAEV